VADGKNILGNLPNVVAVAKQSTAVKSVKAPHGAKVTGSGVV